MERTRGAGSLYFSETDSSTSAETDGFFSPENQIHVKKLNFYSGEDVLVVVTNPHDVDQLIVVDVGRGGGRP